VKKIIPLIIFVLILLVIFLPRFIINVRIECKSQVGNCPNSVVEKISPLTGKKLSYAKGRLTKTLTTEFLVSDFSIQFKLPNILKVDLIVKKPIYALRGNDGILVLVDKEGIVIEVATGTNLPMAVTTEDLPKVGERVDGKRLSALKLIDGVSKMYQTGTGNIEGDTLLVELPGPVRVIFPLAGSDVEFLLGSLRLIYTNMQDGESRGLYSQVDLRYRNPVLR